jgi:hypothetical protein
MPLDKGLSFEETHENDSPVSNVNFRESQHSELGLAYIQNHMLLNTFNSELRSENAEITSVHENGMAASHLML